MADTLIGSHSQHRLSDRVMANTADPPCGLAPERAGHLAVQQLIPGLAVEALHAAVLPGAAGLDTGGPGADAGGPALRRLGHDLGAVARTDARGRTPRATGRPASASMASAEPSLRATRTASAPRANSSATRGMRNLRPPRVRSSTRSWARTRLRRSGRSRAREPSPGHGRPRFGCLGGAFGPSRRRIRSTRPRLAHQPATRGSAVTRR
jgi:hypothetical protein